MSEPASTAEHYHERTKYKPATLGRGHGMDWSKKPHVFKMYQGAETFPMAHYLSREGERSLFSRRLETTGTAPDAATLARILFFTNGLTASSEAPGEPGGHVFYRAAPSAGALYPTELYVVVRTHPEIPSGVYNVSFRGHSLQRISPPGFGPEGDELHRLLFDATAGSSFVERADITVIATAIWYRSAWRYGPRAYRRCMLDTGHVIGNLVAYSPLERFVAIPHASFVDSEICSILGIDPKDEGPLAVIPLVDHQEWSDVVHRTKNPTVPGLRSSPFAKRLEAESDDALLPDIASASVIDRKEVRMSSVQTDSSASSMLRQSKYRFSPGVEFSEEPPDLVDELAFTIIRRRSTRAFSGETVRLEDLARLLEYAYRADLVMKSFAVPQLFDPSLLETWVVAQNIDGLTPGVYLYVPDSRELRLVDSGDFRRESHYLALGQDLAGLAGAVVFHTCDLPAAVKRWGDRAYRMMHMDAGHLGQRMNLAAIALGLGVSGIGGFLDEEVNSLLGIPEREACVYITCIGVPASS